MDDREADALAHMLYDAWTRRRDAGDLRWPAATPDERAAWREVAHAAHRALAGTANAPAPPARHPEPDLVIRLPDELGGGHAPQSIGTRGGPSVTLVGAGRLVAAGRDSRHLYLIAYDLAQGRHHVLARVPTRFHGEDVCVDLLDHDGHGRLVAANGQAASASLYRIAGDRIVHTDDVPLPPARYGWAQSARFVPGFRHLVAVSTSTEQSFCSIMDVDVGVCRFAIGEKGWRAKDICFLAADRAVLLLCRAAPCPDDGEPRAAKACLLAIDIAAKTHAILAELALGNGDVDACARVGDQLYVTCGTRGSILVVSVAGNRLVLDGELAGPGMPYGVDCRADERVLAVTDGRSNAVALTRLPRTADAAVDLAPPAP